MFEMFGVLPSTFATMLCNNEVALGLALENTDQASVHYTSKGAQWAPQVADREPLVHWVCPSSAYLQNAMFNGSWHRIFMTGTLLFGADGTFGCQKQE
ncbi:hypothetical protein H257_11635 [Aphanomyces astaci]|uniref:Uncharacterized protein n=1 Tax=Aphanomyces astaci TaxID=112090 RepID=W4G1D5_APHAT|nr:hypothetical protein H257_11635 [Aphanomyces astaci]ETV73510.1 hypothetical protein H257_11635 [Aphanomyces astaci]|eukprot:XP_009836936.1 hypothetical protein H257_11635 [Aphanomyces astaci]